MSRAGLAVVLTLLLAPALGAQEVTSGDVVVRLLPGLPDGATHGCHEIVFMVTNHSPARSHEVRFEAPAEVYPSPYFPGRLRMSRATVVGPGASLRVALLQPPLALAGSGLRVVVDGRAAPEVPFDTDHPSSRTYRPPSPSGGTEELALRVLVSQGVDAAALPETTDTNRYREAVSPPEAWSGDWLAYSGYDGVVLTAGDLSALKGQARDALRRYAESGGAVLAMGTDAAVLELPPAVDELALAVSYTGLGVVMAAPEVLSAEQLGRVAGAWERSSAPWSLASDPGGFHQRFPVVDKIRVPVRGIFLMIVAFALLIGPVNLLLLARRGRRIWLLWTVPAAALLACLAIFAYTLADEGLLRVRRGASLTVLDERSHRAVTLAWTGYYSTLTPAGGLRFASDVEVTPVTQPFAALKTLDLSDGQHLAAGWVSARLPAYFMMRRNALRRERLRVRRSGDALEVTNGLGVEIAALRLADAAGLVYGASVVAAGATEPLTGPVAVAAGRPSSLRELYDTDLPRRLQRLREKPEDFLRPGTYVAVLAADPFLEPGIDGLRESRSEAVVFGFLEEAP